MVLPSMGGKTVAILEARRAAELARLIATYGGIAYPAPALREEPIEDPGAVADLLDRAGAIDVVVLQTGVGAQALFDAAAGLGRSAELRELLGRALVVARGPKPVGVLQGLGVRVDLRAAEPYTTAELLAALADRPLGGKVVALQHYGEPNRELVAALRARGAEVLDLEVYRWLLPEDLAPLERLLQALSEGGVDALIVTSQVQVRHLFEVADRLGLDGALPRSLDGVTVAAVGPVVARALRARGVRVDLEPSHPKMGPLVRDLASWIERSHGA